MTSLVDKINSVTLSQIGGGTPVFDDDGLVFSDGSPTFRAIGQGAIINDVEGVLYTEMQLDGIDSTMYVLTLSADGFETNFIQIRVTTLEQSEGIVVRFGGTQAQLTGAPAHVIGTTFKMAMSYIDNECRLYVNGTEVTNDTFATMPTGLNQVHVGTSSVTPGPIDGTVKELRYYDLADGGEANQAAFLGPLTTLDPGISEDTPRASLALQWFFGPAASGGGGGGGGGTAGLGVPLGGRRLNISSSERRKRARNRNRIGTGLV